MKKIISKSTFKKNRKVDAKKMSQDKKLQKNALDLPLPNSRLIQQRF